MNAFESSCQAFVVAPESSESREPSEAAFDHPPSGKQNKAFPGLLKLNDLKLDSMLACIFGRLFPGIALVNPSELNILAGSLLSVLGEPGLMKTESHLSMRALRAFRQQSNAPRASQYFALAYYTLFLPP